jgi:hypothetical protein
MDDTLNVIGAFILAVLGIILIYASVKFVIGAIKNPDPGKTANGVGAVAIALIPAALGGAVFLGVIGAVLGWIKLPGVQ